MSDSRPHSQASLQSSSLSNDSYDSLPSLMSNPSRPTSRASYQLVLPPVLSVLSEAEVCDDPNTPSYS
ncbi:hypothetical protein P7C70_g8095, partial [Phenoliferia sp. Uapishka_3]